MNYIISSDKPNTLEEFYKGFVEKYKKTKYSLREARKNISLLLEMGALVQLKDEFIARKKFRPLDYY